VIRRVFLSQQSLDALRQASRRGRWPLPPLELTAGGAYLEYRIVERLT
jgi:hypothetical protein